MVFSSSNSNFLKCHDQQYNAVHICRLVGHEGSIFRIVWSSCGAKLVSVSDDRRLISFLTLFFPLLYFILELCNTLIWFPDPYSARIWTIHAQQNDCDEKREVVGPVLFGHSARIWDCCISHSVRFKSPWCTNTLPYSSWYMQNLRTAK